MDEFITNMFSALRAADRVIVDGLHVKTFQLEGSEGGSGILNLEDGTAISFANQEITIIGGYSAFHTEAPRPHSIDFIMLGDRALENADIIDAPRTRASMDSARLRLRPIESQGSD